MKKIIILILAALFISNISRAQDTLYIHQKVGGILKIEVNNIDSINFSPKPPRIDPGKVAPSNLVAYFPFDKSGDELINGLTPKASPNVNYVAGQRGNAYQGMNNAYFLYDLPTDNKLTSLKAFTVSLWLNAPQLTFDIDPVPMMFQIKNDNNLFWGNLSLTQDRMSSTESGRDSLKLKIIFYKQNVAWNYQFIGFSNPSFKVSEWIHLIFEYDNTTSTYSIFVNGTKLVLPDQIANRWADAPSSAGGSQPPLGDMGFSSASQFVIGGWFPKISGEATDTWLGWFTGKMDELRIYDRALTPAEAKALYDAEASQLN